MSDETADTPEISTPSAAKSVPRVRRISTPRPKKVAKKSSDEADTPSPVAEETRAAEPAARVEEPVAEQASAVDAEWPEPEAASVGGASSPSESAKRKRRRRKGKGQSGVVANGGGNGNGNAAHELVPSVASPEPGSAEAPPESRPRPAHVPQAPPQHAPRPKIDPELLTKMAWKIYLAEVSEEGVALIGDQDAKDLSRRCFRLAEIFIEEQLRRR